MPKHTATAALRTGISRTQRKVPGLGSDGKPQTKVRFVNQRYKSIEKETSTPLPGRPVSLNAVSSTEEVQRKGRKETEDDSEFPEDFSNISFAEPLRSHESVEPEPVNHEVHIEPFAKW